MEAEKAILTRRSIRSFSKRRVSKKIIQKILDCAISSPSAKNFQPWYFIVDDTPKKNKLAEILREKFASEFTVMNPRTEKPAAANSSLVSMKILEDCPTVILVFSNSPFIGGREEILKKPQLKYLLTYESEIESIAAAVQNILISANSLGVGSLWVNDVYFIAKDVEHLYGQKKDFITAICLGYPKSKPDYEIKRKKNYEFVK